MTSTNTKLLLASTALVSAISVAGIANAANIDVAAAGITDGSTGSVSTLTHTDTDSSTTINNGDSVQTTGAITFGADESIAIAADVTGTSINIDHNITGAAGQTTALVILTGTDNTLSVSDTVTIDTTNNADAISIVGANNTVNVNGTLTAGTGNGITVSDVDGTTLNVNSGASAGDIDASALTGTNNVDITVTAATTGAIDAGTGADTLTVTGSGASTIGAVNLGAGNNTVTVSNTSGTAAFTSLATGAGDDTLTVSGTMSGSSNLGDGANTVTVSGTSGDITTGAGNDTLTVSGTAGAINTGAGINSLTVNGGTTGAITAAGTDTITLTGNDTAINGLITASGTSATVIISGGATSASQTEIDGFTGATAGAADDTFTVNSGWVNSSAALTNVEDININGGNVTLNSIAGTETADLTVANGATLNITGASVVDTSATVAGTATFTGALTGGADTNVTGTMNFGAASHTVGDLFIGSAGKVAVDKAGDLTVTSVDNINKVLLEVDGAGAYATLTSGEAVDFSSSRVGIKIAQSVDLSDIDGDTFADIVTGTSAASPTTGNFVASNGLLQYTWSANTATAYDLEINLATTGVTTLAGAATGGNNKGVAGSVDSSALASLYTEVLASDNVDTALESLTPDVSGGAGAASINTSVASTGTVSNRLALLRGTDNGRSGMVAGEHMMANREMWLQAFGTNVEQDERKGVKGFDATTGGFAIGVDTDEIVHGGRVGVAFAYAKADVDSDQANNAQTDIDTYQLTAYGSKDLANDMYVDGMISYAFNEHEGSRTDFLNDTYTADYDGNQFSVKGEVGKSYDWANTRVTPNFGLHYIMVETDDYTETGSGANGQSVDTDNQSALLVSLGADMEWNITGRDGSEYMPYLRAKYSYDAIGDEVETTSTFLGGGTAFTAQGADIARHSLGLGAGVNVVTTAGFEFTAGYDAEVKEDFLAHTGMLQARWSF
ncbi:MAG: hypothetical protein CMF60_06390 [Magnetococcales bacterium]|nr:hypothetical protein [Magnetococcales bacterium]|tara:strand:+ start:66856 stop:69735 length:2880 start_codon:yes stop_codon:yes gene_type:complete